MNKLKLLSQFFLMLPNNNKKKIEFKPIRKSENSITKTDRYVILRKSGWHLFCLSEVQRENNAKCIGYSNKFLVIPLCDLHVIIIAHTLGMGYTTLCPIQFNSYLLYLQHHHKKFY